MLLALAEPAAASDVSWVGPTKFVLQPLLTLGTLAMLFRVVLSWFPKYDLKEMPWILVAAPTEPILKFTRLVIPPVAGVDISPIVWVSILSFISEILTGPQCGSRGSNPPTRQSSAHAHIAERRMRARPMPLARRGLLSIIERKGSL